MRMRTRIICTCLLTLLVFTTGTNANASTFSFSSTVTAALSTRWKITSKVMGNIVENGLLLLMTGSPIQSVRQAMDDLRQCVGKVYDEEVVNCLDGPDRVVAGSLLVLTDYHTWIWPPDIDVVDDIMLDVITRRLKPRVRPDQCGKDKKPTDDEYENEQQQI